MSELSATKPKALKVASARLNSRADVISYLQKCGLRAAEDCEVSIRFGRNIVVDVNLPNGKNLVLKQGLDRGEFGDGSLLNEGLFHYYVQSRGIASDAKYLAGCRLHDRKSDILVFDHIVSENLRERNERTGRLSCQSARSLGASLGTIHAITSRDRSRDVVALGDRASSLIPSSNDLTPEALASLTHSEIEICRILQENRHFSKSLAALSRTWKGACVIHGDFRMENILVPKDSPETPILIDWELCRYGDPAYDLGTFIGDIVRTCIDRIRPSEQPPDGWVIEANMRLRRFSRAIRAFLEGYSHAARALLEARPSLPALGMAYAGVFLLNRAGSSGELRGRFQSQDLMYVAVAERLVQNPFSNLKRLLGSESFSKSL